MVSKLGERLVYSRVSHLFSRWSRAKKTERFQQLVNSSKANTVLDVGAGIEWVGAQNTLYLEYCSGKIQLQRLVAIGIEDMHPLALRYPRIGFLQGNGTSLPLADKSFDVAYSNAVIEHIFPISSRKSFIAELLRVAHGIFITTPNKYFPIEVHTRLPFIHWLPQSLANQILGRIGLAYLARGTYFESMSVEDIKACFPSNISPQIELGFLGATIMVWYLTSCTNQPNRKAEA